MRYTIEYNNDTYDDPEHYAIRDTVQQHIVARVNVMDFRAVVPVGEDFVQVQRGLLNAQLRALDTAVAVSTGLELASQNGDLS